MRRPPSLHDRLRRRSMNLRYPIRTPKKLELLEKKEQDLPLRPIAACDAKIVYLGQLSAATWIDAHDAHEDAESACEPETGQLG